MPIKFDVLNRCKPHLFNENWQEECAGGIHFYITREEAEAHP